MSKQNPENPENPSAAKSKKSSKKSGEKATARVHPDAIETDRPERGGPFERPVRGERGPSGRGRRGPRRGPDRGGDDRFDPDAIGGPSAHRGHGHRHPGEGRGPGRGGRARRGEVRNGVLALLAEGPKHGYQIIQELGERSGGAWTPSPGSVYPILHRLQGAGVVDAEDFEDGRRVFTLTSTGQLVVDRLDLEKSPPWATMGSTESDEARELRRLAVQFDGAVGQVADVATPDQLTRAAAIVAEARRRLYALLAEEPASPTRVGHGLIRRGCRGWRRGRRRWCGD